MKNEAEDRTDVWLVRFLGAVTVLLWVITLIFLIKFAPDLIDNVMEVIDQIKELRNV